MSVTSDEQQETANTQQEIVDTGQETVISKNQEPKEVQMENESSKPFPDEWMFWEQKKIGASIKPRRFAGFLTRQGFRRLDGVGGEDDYQIVKIIDQIIEVMTPPQIRDDVIAFFEGIQFSGEFDVDFGHIEHLLEELVLRGKEHCDYSRLSTVERLINPEYVSKSPESSVLFYQNTAVLVDSDGATQVPYSEVKVLIHREQILKRDFSPDDERGDFEHFVRRTCHFKNEDSDEYELDEQSLDSVETSLGYLVHSYKDPIRPKVCLFIDSVTEENAAADGKGRLQTDGGTGKTLLLGSLRHLLKLKTIDGKNHNQQNQFSFGGVTDRTNLVLFDDINKGFNFEKLFSMVTGDMEVEEKYKPRTTIPRDKSPKLAVSSNHAIGVRGHSFERRIHIHQTSDYWTELSKQGLDPVDELKSGRLFDDWNDDEWNRFDSYICRCVSKYLRRGLVQARKNEYVFAKSMSTIGSRDIAVWIRDRVVEDWSSFVNDNKGHGKPARKIHEEFTKWRNQSGESFKGWTQRHLTESIRIVAEDLGYEFNTGFKRNQVRVDGEPLDCIRITPEGYISGSETPSDHPIEELVDGDDTDGLEQVYRENFGQSDIQEDAA